MLPLEKVSFDLVGLHEVSIHGFDVQVSSDTQMMGHKKFLIFLIDKILKFWNIIGEAEAQFYLLKLHITTISTKYLQF